MLGLPKATGFLTFTVSAYSGDKPRLELKGTDLRLGKGTSYTVEHTITDLASVLEEPLAVGRYGLRPYATVTGRVAIVQITERLRDVALAALSALAQDPGFAEWFLAAHVEALRTETIRDLERRIDYAKMSLVDDERELQQCQDILDAVGPLTNEQLRLALALTKSKHSLGTAIKAARKI